MGLKSMKFSDFKQFLDLYFVDFGLYFADFDLCFVCLNFCFADFDLYFINFGLCLAGFDIYFVDLGLCFAGFVFYFADLDLYFVDLCFCFFDFGLFFAYFGLYFVDFVCDFTFDFGLGDFHVLFDLFGLFSRQISLSPKARLFDNFIIGYIIFFIVASLTLSKNNSDNKSQK